MDGQIDGRISGDREREAADKNGRNYEGRQTGKQMAR